MLPITNPGVDVSLARLDVDLTSNEKTNGDEKGSEQYACERASKAATAECEAIWDRQFASDIREV